MFHLTETLSAYQARDPAARSKLEVFLLYPGVHATMYHQAAHLLLLSQDEVFGPYHLPVEPLLDRH